MKVTDTKAISGIEKVTSSSDHAAVSSPKDRITVADAREVGGLVAAAQATSAKTRSVRLKELEQQVRAGSYNPSPSKVAEEILHAAEIDARLQAMLMH